MKGRGKKFPQQLEHEQQEIHRLHLESSMELITISAEKYILQGQPEEDTT